MRRLCRAFAVFLPVFSLIIGAVFIHPNEVFAVGADKIGTHLIQGDVTQQQNVLNKLSSKGLKSSKYPVVVMVYPDGAGTSLLTSGFLSIARVNVTCTTDVGQMATLAGQIPAGTPVVIGNEINNQNTKNGEWPCGDFGKYADLFNAFAAAWNGKGPLGISPMDTINGDFDAAPVLAKIFATNINRGEITAVFANVYQTGGCGYEARRCSTDGGQWVIEQINRLAGKSFTTADLYITEFGITTCGDYDCLQTFYEDHNDLAAKAIVGFSRPPGEADGTTWIHTVPAVCEYWELGSLKVEKPERCGGGKRSAFVYPGIEDMAPDETKMRQMASGYTLMCGNQFKVQGDISGGWGTLPPGVNAPDCTKNPPDNQCVISGVFGNVILDDTGTKIPLFRMQGVEVPNPTNAKRRFDDLEGYFGATYVQEGAANPVAGAENVELLTPLANGVSRKLVSQEAQCNMTLQYLNTIKSLCDHEGDRSGYTYNDKLDADASPAPKLTLPEGDCALYSPIPGEVAQYNTYKKIIDQMPSNFNCSPSQASPATIPAGWLKAFSKIELTTSKGFKPAYLVYYINRPEEQPTTIEKRVNWLAPGEGTSTGIGDERNIKDRIKIEKVYVPAGFAETDITQVNSSLTQNNVLPQPTFFPTYTGGFMQTITSMMPEELQFKIAKDRSTNIFSIGEDMVTGNIFDGARDGIECKTCAKNASQNPLDPRLMIVRRINAGFLDPLQQACTRDDLVGEQAKEHSHTINPSGTLDPVSPTKITASATLIAQRGGGDQETIRTYLLLPEEYRNITDYEQPFLNTFVTAEKQVNNPEFKFAVTKADQDATWKGAYKYLQLTGENTSVISPSRDGPQFSYPDPDQVAPAPIPGQPPAGTKYIDIKVTGKITADRDPSQIHTDPQIPGGILARGLWEIMCNVARPYNGVDTTTKYPGFESFLQKGLAACTDGAIPAGNPPNSSAVCSGTTTVPANLTDLRALVRSVATQMNIPPNILWGTLSMEGSSIFNAIAAGNKTISCGPNSVGAVGPLGILASTCGGRFNNWEKFSVQAGVSGSSPCDLEAALKVASVIMKTFYANPSQHACNVNEGKFYPALSADDRKWVDAAASYNGSCTPLVGVGFNCDYPDKTTNWLTYGECNVIKYAPRL